MNEIVMNEKQLTAGGVRYGALSEDELDEIALDYVPRILGGPRGKGTVAVINANFLRNLLQAKEEYDWMLQQPIQRRCFEELQRAQGRRVPLEQELKEYARRLMNDTCPGCRRTLTEKYGTAEEQDERLWKRVKSIRDYDKPSSMFDRVVRRSGVGVAATGPGVDPPKGTNRL